MRAASLDGLLVARPANVRYLTGFSGSSALVAVSDDRVVLFTDFRYEAQAAKEVGGHVEVQIVPRDACGAASRHCAELGVESIGFEAGGDLGLEEADRLRESATPTYVAAPRLVERLRVTKDPDEVDALRGAVAIAEASLEALLPSVAVGLREIDVAARLESELRIRGSEWPPFPTIVASGPRAALPHAGTSGRTLEAGDWLLVDFGAQHLGYCADLTRTYIVGGRADERQRMTYDLVREAHTRAVDHVTAGMTGAEADALARSIIEARGFGEAFGHSLGHGLGLEVHEDPRVSKVSEVTLPAGAVITIEPGVYFPGWGGVRIEDDVHLTATGGERLSTLSTDLLELT